MTPRICETTDDGMSIFYDPEGGRFPFYLYGPNDRPHVFETIEDARAEHERRAAIANRFEEKRYEKKSRYSDGDTVRNWKAFVTLRYHRRTGEFVVASNLAPEGGGYSRTATRIEKEATEMYAKIEAHIDEITAKHEARAEAFLSLPTNAPKAHSPESKDIFDRLRSWLSA